MYGLKSLTGGPAINTVRYLHMFNLFKKKKSADVQVKDLLDKVSTTASSARGASLATSFLKVMTEGRNAIPVIKFNRIETEKFEKREIESQFSGMSAEQFVIIYEVLKHKANAMKKALEIYAKYHENINKLADDMKETGAVPDEVRSNMKSTSEAEINQRKETYNMLCASIVKLEKMYNLVVEHADTSNIDKNLLLKEE